MLIKSNLKNMVCSEKSSFCLSLFTTSYTGSLLKLPLQLISFTLFNLSSYRFMHLYTHTQYVYLRVCLLFVVVETRQTSLHLVASYDTLSQRSLCPLNLPNPSVFIQWSSHPLPAHRPGCPLPACPRLRSSNAQSSHITCPPSQAINSI